MCSLWEQLEGLPHEVTAFEFDTHMYCMYPPPHRTYDCMYPPPHRTYHVQRLADCLFICIACIACILLLIGHMTLLLCITYILLYVLHVYM